MIRFILGLCAALSLHGATWLLQGPSGNAWSAVHGSMASDDSVRHNNHGSLRVEANAADPDASARSSTIPLTIGKTYEISGWVRTQDLVVKDLDRSPIASGAALTMESMPFDVHSASLAGTHDWTRLSLRFTATRSEDHILITAGKGGALQGKAWFEGVDIDEVSSAGSWPAPEAVQTFGPAYRYPAAGWIYLHIEGKPYDRGYQHGYLMAKEIPEYLNRCAITLAGKADQENWDTLRTTADALFLRGFDREILEEMRGIADGANAAGAKFLDRKVDLKDIVLANTTVELGELASAMPRTATGLENLHFAAPAYAAQHDSAKDHCSAFAATGPATRDGKMVIGHVTWWPQTLAEQTNVMLDIKPERGHRMLIQSYPGGIESGTDWYQNDAGMVLTETTIDQTPFNVRGTPVAFRARMAIQYGGNVDEIVKQLSTDNNGLYTNEWIIGDAKNNEIAMFELGTNHTKLWRSSKNEWFGDTPGFYWGDNNSKDLSINLEYVPDPHGSPTYVPYVPHIRDLAWMDLYKRYNGQIDEQFGFKAFDSAPLVAASTMDSKIVTSDMANHLMVWAEIGRPNETVAPPRDSGYGLFPGGYHVFNGDSVRPAGLAAHKHSVVEKPEVRKTQSVSWHDHADKLWSGWLLPASEADTWFVAGSAKYYSVLQSTDLAQAMNAERIRYRGLKLSPGTPLTRFQLQETAGVLFLDSLRQKMGNDAFLKLMQNYFLANTTRTVTAQSFLDSAETSYEPPDVGDGPAYLPGDITSRLASAVIIYGTTKEAGTNRYAAEQLQANYRERYQRDVPVYKDSEASDVLLSGKNVIFVGRPETNSSLASWSTKIGLSYEGAMFTVDGKSYASERNALIYVAKNPLDPACMALVYAGNSPLETARSLQATGEMPAIVLENGKLPEPLDKQPAAK